jgi:putative DNA methylase
VSEAARYPKRLIEVDLPIKRIGAHARHEKSIRHGHISTVHIWWARRPLAACRAVILAALWPDPGDPLCPEAFRQAARTRMQRWAIDHLGLVSKDSYTRFVAVQKDPERLNDDAELRRALLDFIADFADWDNSTNKVYLETSRALVQAAHEALGGLPGTRPLVVDPFAGGGSIPLEALRVGADAFASDLNPVAVLLNKVVLEYIPTYGQRLADEVCKWGAWVREQAAKELAQFYPNDPDRGTPIAYLWARTITCEGPACGAEVPLLRSLWLAQRGSNSEALRMIPKPMEKRVDFEIIQDAKLRDIGPGTVRRGAVTCPVCGYTTPISRIREQLRERSGGTRDARMLAIRRGDRAYRLPDLVDITAVQQAQLAFDSMVDESVDGLSIFPNESTPTNQGHRAVGSPYIYGMRSWRDLFTPKATCFFERY